MTHCVHIIVHTLSSCTIVSYCSCCSSTCLLAWLNIPPSLAYHYEHILTMLWRLIVVRHLSYRQDTYPDWGHLQLVNARKCCKHSKWQMPRLWKLKMSLKIDNVYQFQPCIGSKPQSTLTVFLSAINCSSLSSLILTSSSTSNIACRRDICNSSYNVQMTS